MEILTYDRLIAIFWYVDSQYPVLMRVEINRSVAVSEQICSCKYGVKIIVSGKMVEKYFDFSAYELKTLKAFYERIWTYLFLFFWPFPRILLRMSIKFQQNFSIYIPQLFYIVLSPTWLFV
jgi:hypothetical protein